MNAEYKKVNGSKGAYMVVSRAQLLEALKTIGSTNGGATCGIIKLELCWDSAKKIQAQVESVRNVRD